MFSGLEGLGLEAPRGYFLWSWSWSWSCIEANSDAVSNRSTDALVTVHAQTY